MHVRPLAHAALIAVLVALVAVLVAAGASGAERSPAVRTTAHGHLGRHTEPLSLSGLNETLTAAGTYGQALVEHQRAELERIAAEDAARRAREAAARVRPRSSAPLGGPCAASKPPGFPDSIIQRESNGDPSAVNRSSGAAGCAQILPSHFSAGCSGMSYDECWAYLWAGGRGASNWACTPESGCRG